MILTEQDFEIFGDKVKLDIWLRKYEMDEILSNQDKAEKYDKYKWILDFSEDPDLIVMKRRELEKENKQLKKQWDEFFEDWKDESGKIKPAIVAEIRSNKEKLEKLESWCKEPDPNKLKLERLKELQKSKQIVIYPKDLKTENELKELLATKEKSNDK